MSKDDDFDFYCEVALKPGAKIVKVYESESVLAFHHTKPSYERHIVVVPKKHVKDIRKVEDNNLFQEILLVCKNIVRSWPDEEVELKGARIITNLGKFQDSPHLHFHVVLGNFLTGSY